MTGLCLIYCKVCGGILPKRRTKFCSDKCSKKYGNKDRKEKFYPNVRKYRGFKPRKNIKCLFCGKEKNVVDRGKFCSSQCQKQYTYKKRKEKTNIYNKICIVCGKKFKTTKKQKNCSKECIKIYNLSLRHINSPYNKTYKDRTIEQMCKKKYKEYQDRLNIRL